MGQFRCVDGRQGDIVLVESTADAARVEVRSPDQVAFVTQTTLSMDDTGEIIAVLQQRFPHIRGPKRNDICYATQNRQDAVKSLAEQCDLILVVGSRNSSNSNRLRELAEKKGTPAHLIDGAEDIDPQWIGHAAVVGVTAGASAPEVLVSGVIDRLKSLGADSVEENHGVSENVTFVLPKKLQDMLRGQEPA